MSNDNNRNQGNPGQKNPQQQPGSTHNNPMGGNKDKSRENLNNNPKIDPNKQRDKR